MKTIYMLVLGLLSISYTQAQNTDSLSLKAYQNAPILENLPNLTTAEPDLGIRTNPHWPHPRLKVDSCECKNGMEKEACANNALQTYIRKHQHYSAIDKEMGNQGRVFMRLTITVVGEMTNIEMAKNTSPSQFYEADAMRIMLQLKEEMSWIPGGFNGVPVDTRIIIPIVYKLD